VAIPYGEPVVRRSAHLAILAAAVLVGAAERIAIVCRRPEALLAGFGSDDMFYYTEVARHIVKGEGMSFDGVHPTSGVQPLWVLFLVPWAPLFEAHPALAMRIDLALITLVTVASGCLMPRVVNALLGREPWRRGVSDAHIEALGTLAGCVWLLHPRVLGVTFEGTEGALAALCWQASIIAWSTERRDSDGLRLGVALGIGALARIDHLALALTCVVWPRGARRSLCRALGILLPAVALYGTWLVFCLHTTGSVVPDSGAAIRLAQGRYLALMRYGSPDGPGGISGLWGQVHFAAAMLRDTVSLLFRAGGHLSRFTVAAALGLATWLALASKRSMAQTATGAWRDAAVRVAATTAALSSALWPVVLAAASALLGYAIVLHHVRSWYTMPAQLLVTLLASAMCLDAAVAARGAWDLPGRPKLLAVTCAIWVSVAWAEEITSPRRSWHPSYVRAARTLLAVTETGSRIGAFNSGILGAFSSEGGRRVTNLDGVVNHGALLANETRTLSEYITGEGIEFIADFPVTISVSEKTGAPGLEARLELVEAVPIDNHPGQSLGIWHVRAIR
jgi:hypothetical protein